MYVYALALWVRHWSYYDHIMYNASKLVMPAGCAISVGL